MTTQTHTPGPWTFDRLGGGWGCIIRNGAPAKDTFRIAELAESPQIEANARLIAAAPDLLAALQDLMEFWDAGTPVHPGAEVVSQAREAISKATA